MLGAGERLPPVHPAAHRLAVDREHQLGLRHVLQLQRAVAAPRGDEVLGAAGVDGPVVPVAVGLVGEAHVRRAQPLAQPGQLAQRLGPAGVVGAGGGLGPGLVRPDGAHRDVHVARPAVQRPAGLQLVQRDHGVVGVGPGADHRDLAAPPLGQAAVEHLGARGAGVPPGAGGGSGVGRRVGPGRWVGVGLEVGLGVGRRVGLGRGVGVGVGRWVGLGGVGRGVGGRRGRRRAGGAHGVGGRRRRRCGGPGAAGEGQEDGDGEGGDDCGPAHDPFARTTSETVRRMTLTSPHSDQFSM